MGSENNDEAIIRNSFDMERALYASRSIALKDCAFDGPADGESALKESEGIRFSHCFWYRRVI